MKKSVPHASKYYLSLTYFYFTRYSNLYLLLCIKYLKFWELSICMYVRIYIYIYVCTYIYTYIHTYIHTYKYYFLYSIPMTSLLFLLPPFPPE
jgi:hypothetical protein